MSGYDIRKLALTPAQKILSEVAGKHGLTVAGVIKRDHTTVSYGAHAHADRNGLPKPWRTREAR